MWERRLVVITLASLVFLPLAHAEDPPAPRSLAEGVWLVPGGTLPNRQPDGNTVVLKGDDGLIVFDTGRHGWHRQAILELATRERIPIAAIVNSHWHLDHVSGNPHLKAAYPAATVYATAAIEGALRGFLKESAAGSREYLKQESLHPDLVDDIKGDLSTFENVTALLPDRIVTETADHPIAGRTVRLNVSTYGPTAADIWLYDETTRIVATGDLVTLPVPFLDTACTGGWQRALESVARVPFDSLVPGHGIPMTRDEFGTYVSAFSGLVACSASEADAGTCAEGWAKSVGGLLAANGMDAGRSIGMVRYYVEQVLRPNGGNSKWCSQG